MCCWSMARVVGLRCRAKAPPPPGGVGEQHLLLAAPPPPMLYPGMGDGPPAMVEEGYLRVGGRGRELES